MKVILTGAAGFIGSCTLWKLNSMGIDQVYAVDTESDPSTYKTLKKKKLLDYLTREDLLAQIKNNKLNDVDLIIHLGACSDTTERDENYLKKNNTDYSQTLATWALEKNIEFHYASSASVYGDGNKGYSDSPADFDQFKGLNLYAESKRNFDAWVYKENLQDKLVGFRYFNVFGPNEYHKGNMMSMVAKAYKQITADGEVRLFESSRPGYENGSEKRDFVYVKDIVDVMAWFIENKEAKGIFNLGTGHAREFKDLVTAVFSALDKKPNIKWIPMPEKLKGQYQYFTEADLTNLRNIGFDKKFMTLEESVKDYVLQHLAKADPYL